DVLKYLRHFVILNGTPLIVGFALTDGLIERRALVRQVKIILVVVFWPEVQRMDLDLAFIIPVGRGRPEEIDRMDIETRGIPGLKLRLIQLCGDFYAIGDELFDPERLSGEEYVAGGIDFKGIAAGYGGGSDVYAPFEGALGIEGLPEGLQLLSVWKQEFQH